MDLRARIMDYFDRMQELTYGMDYQVCCHLYLDSVTTQGTDVHDMADQCGSYNCLTAFCE